MELRLPLEVFPGRQATCRAVFGTWGSFPDDARASHCPFVLTFLSPVCHVEQIYGFQFQLGSQNYLAIPFLVTQMNLCFIVLTYVLTWAQLSPTMSSSDFEESNSDALQVIAWEFISFCLHAKLSPDYALCSQLILYSSLWEASPLFQPKMPAILPRKLFPDILRTSHFWENGTILTLC